MDGLFLIPFCVAAFAGGFVSGFSGFAMGLVVSGVWLHIITPIQTAALIAGYGLLTQGYGILKLRQALNWRAIWPLSLGTTIGIPIGVLLLTYINPAYLRLGVGVLLVLYAIYSLARPAFKPMKIGAATDIGIGFVNGLVGGVTGLGGVVSTISCQWRGWTRDAQRAVFQPVLFAAFVMISISLTVTGAFTAETIKLYGLGLPFMLVGIWSGFKLYGKIDDEMFRKVVLILILLAALSLIVPARFPAREDSMSLKTIGTIAIPNAEGSEFDHAAFDPKSRRVFIAHTARDCVEVIDHDAGKHLATLPGFPGVAGAVADDGQILITNRGSASIALLDAGTLESRATYKTGGRPNGAVIVARLGLGIAACIGVDGETPTLQLYGLSDRRHVSIDLPGRPRWCVTDAAAERIFLCIREPSMVLVAHLPELGEVTHWKVPSAGAHGLDIDHSRGRLYVACDDATLVEMSSTSGEVTNVWPIGGPPDVTFFNPATGLVHVAIGEPGLVDTIDPRSGQTTRTVTGAGAHTTALAAPDRLYVISPAHGGILVLSDA